MPFLLNCISCQNGIADIAKGLIFTLTLNYKKLEAPLLSIYICSHREITHKCHIVTINVFSHCPLFSWKGHIALILIAS